MHVFSQRLVFLAFAFSAQTAFAAARVPWTSNRVTGSPNPPAPYTVERRFPKLNFRQPVDIAAMPGSDRLFVLEQGGKLRSFPDRPDVATTDQVFDFRVNHRPFDSSYAIAFHPRFLENRFLFVCYVEPGTRPNGSFISRFTLRDSDPPTIDPSSEKVILRWLSGGHNGCTLAFGNDGFLYISTGDAANPDPPDMPYNTGQDISDLLSSILRIDVDRTEGTNNYAIPADNPFRQIPGARGEVYAFGLRNPWRMSIDRPTGDLWIGDVGWEQWEMIYRAKPGANFGWSLTEGPNTHVRTNLKPGPGPIQPPLVALPHSDAASITGGYVYHGEKLKKLQGAYLYGDWETGKFWALRQEADKLISNAELCDTTLKPSSFGLDRKGEFLIVDYNGGLYEFVPNTAPAANLAFPRRLSETGLFADTATLSAAPGVLAYHPNAQMWSDYASAQHLVGVPDVGSIATAGGRETITGRMWFFPSNTVFARTVNLEMERGQPGTRRRVETQLMHFDGQTWNAYTYRWNAAQADADLVPSEGTNDVYTIADASAPGGRRQVQWRFSGRAECLRCHNVWAGDTLSFNWFQLNSPGPTSELKRLEEDGILRIRNRPNPLPRLSNPYDASFSLEERARSWLHLNCSPCHRNGAGGDVPAQFNIDQPFDKSRALDAVPVRGDFGILDAHVVTSGDPYRSTLFYRINTEGSGRMPHIGSRLVDEAGVRLLRDWIQSLPPKGSEEKAARAAIQERQENSAALAELKGEKRAAAITNLLSNMSGALALLTEANRAAWRSEAADAAAGHTNALIRDLFQRLLPLEQRRQALGSDFSPETVLSVPGNEVRGRELFVGIAQCARCHVANGVGRPFGPDLTEIAKKYDRAQLLDNILHPSKTIAPEFKTFYMTLADDAEVNGFIVRRSDSEVVLRDESLADRHLSPAQIKESRESAVSAMPEGLLAPLTAQEGADLIEFFLARRKP